MKFFIILIVLVFKGSLSNAQDSLNRMDISELLFNSTIKIQGTKDSPVKGKIQKYTSVGTGFFFSYIVGKDTIQTIVTNEHVIRNCKTGIFKFNSASNNKPQYGDILTITLSNFDRLWIKHPTEDLAILPLQPIKIKLFNLTKKLSYAVTFSEIDIPSSDQLKALPALQEVLMIGYPKGFYDTVNNVPILRQGVTASPMFINYNNQSRFLLDIPIYTGSSGSPVSIYNSGTYSDGKGGIVVGNRFYFVGIATESRNYEAKGTTITNDPSKRLETKTSLPFEIAIVIKSSMLLDFKPLLAKAIKDESYLKLIDDLIKK